MIVKFFKAECGDAAAIRYFGDDGKFHNIFVDSGYGRTFRFVIESEIKRIIDSGERIDLWIISHIHDDHIGGVLKYIETIRSGEYLDVVDQFFYNPPRRYQVGDLKKDISAPVSISQGDLLYEYLKSTDKLLDFDITSTVGPFNFFSLKITLLGPSSNNLQKLRSKYPLEANNPFEKEENENISGAISQTPSDYHRSLDDFEIMLKNEDASVENGSSISFITEFQGTSILWLADSHPSDIRDALISLGISETSKVNCDLVKVSHHGSSGNNSMELYSLINCNNYVFSVNGDNKHNLPSKECIAKILRIANREASSNYSLYFTYDDITLKSIFESDDENVFKKYNFSVIYCPDNEILFTF